MHANFIKDNFERIYNKVEGVQSTLNKIQVDVALLKNDKKWFFRVAAGLGAGMGLIGTFVAQLFLRG